MAGKKNNLYETIVQDIKEKILDRTYKTDERIPTEFELAQQYGVSRITSKRALEELKNEGFIYRKQGSGSYVSDHFDSMPKQVGQNCIAVITPHFVSSGSFSPTIRGASETIQKNGLVLKLFTSVKSSQEVDFLLQKLYREHIAGIIYYPFSDNENIATLSMLAFEKFPLVTIDKYFDSIPVCSVVSDNIRGGFIAAKYLIDKGHSRIAFVSDIPLENASSIRDRYFGYCKALVDNNIKLDVDLVVQGGWTTEYPRKNNSKAYMEIVQQLLFENVTGICAANDIIASYILQAAFKLNISVPEQLSVTGFDNSEVSGFLQPPLTTIAQDFYQMGEKAGTLVCKAFNAGTLEYSGTVLPVSLIERESVKSIN